MSACSIGASPHHETHCAILITNLAALVLLSIIACLFNLDVALARQGMSIGSLLIMAGLIGFIGSFISLAMSKRLAKYLMGVRVIDWPASDAQAWLIDVIRDQAPRNGCALRDRLHRVAEFPSVQRFPTVRSADAIS